MMVKANVLDECHSAKNVRKIDLDKDVTLKKNKDFHLGY